MDTSLVLVLLLAPFLGFLFNVFIGKKAGKSIVGIVGTLSVAVSFSITLYLFGYNVLLTVFVFSSVNENSEPTPYVLST